ncbi:PREDICTED: uncharacterized protein LOC104825119 [Tarenaya hassleriana]|uniref:uncharacterized protein LOC104825119 n=1 Tax=Tarenaya hassleriana TaxID=28532 RepID=UPI00053C1E3A|nr:PREDICTED: uncharacterized protein LOC104825119 [Tarenaya hassleriana]
MDNHITKILCNAPAPKRRRTKKKGEVFSSKCNELPAEVVYEIMKHLALPDFLSAGRACEGWRAAAKDMGHTILESFPPLAMSMKSGARKFMSYHNIVNGDRYRSKVLAYVRKEFKGISGGFIAFENCHGIWFGNPVTSKELEFYKPLGFTHLSDRSILVKRIPSEDYLVLVLYRRCKTIHAIRHGTTDWLMFSYCHAPWDIVDLVVCNERVFGLTSDGRLGIIGLTASSITFRMILMERRQFMMNAKLVSYDGEQIMVAEYLGPRQVRITRADMNPDMNLAQWEVLKNLENLSLFVDDYNTYRLCDPSGWGGRTNSVYFLHSRTSVYSVFPYPTSDDDDDDFHDYELCTQHGSPLDNVRGWYFPTLIYSLDRVRDHIHVRAAASC